MQLNRYFVEILKRAQRWDDERPQYVPCGQSGEVLGVDEWDAARRFFTSVGVVSLPTPAFALRIRRLPGSTSGI